MVGYRSSFAKAASGATVPTSKSGWLGGPITNGFSRASGADGYHTVIRSVLRCCASRKLAVGSVVTSCLWPTAAHAVDEQAIPMAMSRDSLRSIRRAPTTLRRIPRNISPVIVSKWPLMSQPAIENPRAHVRSAPDQPTSAAFPASSPWGQEATLSRRQHSE